MTSNPPRLRRKLIKLTPHVTFTDFSFHLIPFGPSETLWIWRDAPFKFRSNNHYYIMTGTAHDFVVFNLSFKK